MSKLKRRHLSAEFKARIAREAMENQKTIQQIAKDNDIAPTQVSAWKKELESRVSEIFERKNATNEASVNFEKKSARLERRIGQLLIEKEFLEGKCNELGIDTSEKPRSHRTTPSSHFGVRALQKAFERTGRKPKVFNTDQGSQFTIQES
ncbi:transposase [Akkermansiaceae bacterium]|nr:transposase [Akkermansiaceae bacterium]